jgi:hypothetical protein
MLVSAENCAIPATTPPIETTIETPEQLRAALDRLRCIEIEHEESPRGRERAELELSICRYLARCEHRIR